MPTPQPPSLAWSGQVDPPIQQDASYAFNATDRAYIDSQVRATQKLAIDAKAAASASATTPTLFGSLATTKAPSNGHGFVLVDGYNVQGDGGGGLFVWNATSVATPDSGTIVQVTGVSTGRWLRVDASSGNYLNVCWFGCDPTGATPSDTGIMAAYNALPATGGTLFFPAGTYLTVGLVFSTVQVRLLGAYGTSPQPSSAPYTTAPSRIHTVTTTAPAVKFTNVNGTYGSMIEHIGLYGSQSGTAQHGILIDNGGVDLKHVEVAGFGGDGVRVRSMFTSRWDRVSSQYNAGYGYNFDPTGSGSTPDVSINHFTAVYSLANLKGGLRAAYSTAGGGFEDNWVLGGFHDINGYGAAHITNVVIGGGHATVTAPNHGMNGGSWVTISGVGGMSGINGIAFGVDFVDENTITLRLSGGVSGTYTSGGTAVISPSGNTFALIPGIGAVTAATNATPIVITQTAHGLNNLDVVQLANVGGNTAANGIWSIHYVDANTYSLYTSAGAASVGNGAYTANTGTMTVGFGTLLDGDGSAFSNTHNVIYSKDERNAAGCFRAHSQNTIDNEIHYTRYTSLPPSFIQTTHSNRFSGANIRSTSYRATECVGPLRSPGPYSSTDGTDALIVRDFGDDADGNVRLSTIMFTNGLATPPDTLTANTALPIPVAKDAINLPLGSGVSSWLSSALTHADAGYVQLLSLNAAGQAVLGAGVKNLPLAAAPTGLSGSGTVVTCVTSLGHGFAQGQTVTFAGNVSPYTSCNGAQVITGIVDYKTFTFANASSGTYAGSGSVSGGTSSATAGAHTVQGPFTWANAAGASASIWGGSGAPPNSLGSTFDYYFRRDGGSGGPNIYQKLSGAWYGITWTQGALSASGGAAATLSNIGAGPTGAAQVKWLPMTDANGATYYIPAWQ